MQVVLFRAPPKKDLLAEKIIKPVIEAEKQSFEQLDSREIEVMFETTYKHMKKLESLIESIKN